MIRFTELFHTAISMWPDEIDVSNKTFHKNTGVSIYALTKIHDEIEESIFLIENNYELRQMDWAIYTVLHQWSRHNDKVMPKEVDCTQVFRFFKRNMEEKKE